MFYGRGAGGYPTASAVLGDVVDAAANLAKGTHATIGTFGRADLRPVDDLVSPYYVNLQVRDEPGVLATVAGVFGAHRVSIRSMEQEGLPDAESEDAARLIFITHAAREADVRATLHELRGLDAVTSVGSVLRVIGVG
ncbi:MAG: ACT domain-containing protein, partial [Microthrixaceae bacterium]